MAKTILITGVSSGIGRETALYFYRQGWNVSGTVRKAGQQTALPDAPNFLLTQADVTSPASLAHSVKKTVLQFGSIDVVVCNAGYGIEGPLESFSDRELHDIFETNFFGVLNSIRAVLPVMKRQREGIIITMSSMGGRLAFPFYTMYHSSKWALEGFCESLQYELAPLGIKVKLIEPGLINTDFFRKMELLSNKVHDEIYQLRYTRVQARKHVFRRRAADPGIVARTIYHAATDAGSRLRYVAGTDAYLQLMLRRFLPEQLLFRLITFFS